MAGSLLGPDQIRKVNATFPALVAHLRSLLEADHTGVGLMRVHCTVESFDSDELARIFRELSFISPKEKLALVRAAIYELLAKEPALFIAPMSLEEAQKIVAAQPYAPPVNEMKTFSPPQFKLNVATSGAAESAKTDTKPTPPVATSTHTAKVAERIQLGDKQQQEQAENLAEETKAVLAHDAAQQVKLDAAAAKLRELSKPTPIEIPAVPADATIPQE